MFIWQNKKHELCVTFNNNKPVDNPDFILNEQSAKIIQSYVEDNKPSCVPHEYDRGTYQSNPPRIIYVCQKCGLTSTKGLKDLDVYVSNTPSVEGIYVNVTHIQDPATIYYNCTYTLADEVKELKLSDKINVENIAEPPNSSVPKTYGFFIPFSNFDTCTSANLYLSIRDVDVEYQRVSEKEYRLDIQQYSRAWKDISIT